jgi:hypothetical protein
MNSALNKGCDIFLKYNSRKITPSFHKIRTRFAAWIKASLHFEKSVIWPLNTNIFSDEYYNTSDNFWQGMTVSTYSCSRIDL